MNDAKYIGLDVQQATISVANSMTNNKKFFSNSNCRYRSDANQLRS